MILLNPPEANRKMEDDGIVLTIFDSVQEEVKVKNQVLEERKVKVSGIFFSFLL